MNNFEKNVTEIWGEAGRVWLADLPSLVERLAELWGLRDLQPVSNLTYNYVLTGRRQADSLPVVLKIGYDRLEIEKEARSLQAYGGHGAVQLLAMDLQLGALLLEQIQPGQSLKSFFPQQDELATEQLVRVMHQLHAAPVQQLEGLRFAHVSNWLKALSAPSAIQKLNGYHLQKAQSLAQDLLQSAGPDVLLHGDLHHDNLLFDANRGWVAIDPKGVLGEAVYEVGAFVRNPFPELLNQPNVQVMIAKRLALFAELLQVDYQRIKAWCYVQAVLSDCWAAEVSNDGSLWLAEAKLIDEL